MNIGYIGKVLYPPYHPPFSYFREKAKNMKKQKPKKTDGLGPYEIKKIRNALRLVWHRSHARKLVVIRCTGKDGFPKCEQCRKKTPALKIDHIENVGDVDGGFIKRLFVASQKLQGLCKKCHDAKTKLERNRNKQKGYGF